MDRANGPKGPMTRRECFQATLEHRRPDRLVLDLAGCPLSGFEGKSHQRLMDLLGYAPDPGMLGPNGVDERILAYLDIDTRGVGGFPTPRKSLARQVSPTVVIDEWGIERTWTGLYWDITRSPLAGADVDDLERYPWPEPESIDIREVEAMRDRARTLFEETDYVLCASHPVLGILELGCWICGFEDFLYRTLADEAFVHRFFDIILGYQKKVIDLYYGLLGPYCHYTSSGDDFATQANSFVSPETFDDLVKPYFRERIAYTKKYTKAAYLHHSCGQVFHLVPSLVDCGVEILNPIQPVSPLMSAESLKSHYGRDVCFHGGIDTQTVLPFGTPDDVAQEVRRVVGLMAEDGGYILAAAHNIQEDVPPENVVAMFQAGRTAFRQPG